MTRLRLSFIAILTSVITVFTLLGYFLRSDAILAIQWILVYWAVIIAAFAVFLGFINVLAVHISKLTGREPGWFYSLVLILSAIAVLAVGLGELIFRPGEGLWGPLMAPIFTWVIVPLQAAAAALLLFVLTYAAYRMLRLTRQRGGIIFLASALVVLITRWPLSGLSVELQRFREIWLSWLVIPGIRAVLIGVALGIAMATWRLIMGIERPHS